MAESPAPPTRRVGGKNVLWIALVVILAIALVGVSAYSVLPKPASKLSVELWYNSDGHYGDTEPALAQVLKSQIEATGKVNVNLKSEPWATYIDDVGAGRLPFFLLGWYPDYFDSDDYIAPFYETSGARGQGSNYSHGEMDTWVSQEAAAADPAERASIFWQIQNRSARDVPYIPLYTNPANVVYDTGMTNVYLHPVSFKWFIMGKPGATQIIGGTTDRISSLDPASGYDYYSIEIMNQVFDTLLVYEPQTATLVPALATEVPSIANNGISADGLTYTYHLRTGVKFHDGTDFNATVMKWSIERAIKLNIDGSAAFLLYTSGRLGRTPTIDTPDDHTIVFHLSQKVGFFNGIMAFAVAAPVSMAAYNNTGQQTDAVGKVVGTGPYKLTEYVQGQRAVLERNTAYYKPDLYASLGIPTIPVLDKVTIQQYSTATNLKTAIETHQINVAYRTLNPTDVIGLQGSAASLNLKVDLGADPRIRFLGFNVENALYSDIGLRQAIAYMVDRKAIDDTVFSGLIEPIYSMLPPGMPYSKPVFQTVYGSSPNIAAANNLLSHLGYSVFTANLIARDES